MSNSICLTTDNINCINTLPIGAQIQTCQTTDSIKCIKLDPAACNAVITQGISEIKGLLTNGVSCSLNSCDPINFGPVTSLIGTSADCTGANANCASVLGQGNNIMGSLGTSTNILGRQVTVFDELGAIKTTIGTGCSESVCSELNNLENLLNNSTNGLDAIKTAVTGSSCNLSPITNLIGTAADSSSSSTLFGKDASILGKLGTCGTSVCDSLNTLKTLVGTSGASTLFQKEDAILGKLGNCTSVCGSLNTLIGASYLKCSDFNAFKTTLNANLKDIYTLVYHISQNLATTPAPINYTGPINGGSYDLLPNITC